MRNDWGSVVGEGTSNPAILEAIAATGWWGFDRDRCYGIGGVRFKPAPFQNRKGCGTHLPLLRGVRAADVKARKGEERGPVGGGGVAGAVLAEGDVAVDERGFDRRELGGGDGDELAAFDRAEGFFAEEFVDGAGCDCGEKCAFGVGPAVALRGPATDEDGARGAERDELMGV